MMTMDNGTLKPWLPDALDGDAAQAELAVRAELRQEIIASTQKLVELALAAQWAEVLDGLAARRQLLQTMIDHHADSGVEHDSSELSALSAAVAESERALMRVIAHAIASANLHGAHFAMYH